MSGLDLHPEDLLDREASGELTASEHAHLRAHLVQCAACRFERQLRADFARELGSSGAASQVGDLVSDALSAAARTQPSALPVAVTGAASRAPRARRLVWLVAAALLCTSGLALARTDVPRSVAQFVRVALGMARPRTPTRSAERGPSQPAPTSSVPAPKPPARKPAPPVPASADDPPPTSRGLGASRAGPSVPRGQTRPAAPARAARVRPPPPSPASATPGVQGPAPVSQGRPDQEFALALQARREGRLGEALARFERLAQTHPQADEGRTGQVLAARMRLDRGQPQAALAGYQRYLAGGARELREQALVGAAEAQIRLGARAGLRETLRRLSAEYPDSPRLRLLEEALEP